MRAPLRHELIELSLVLCRPEPNQEVLKLALLLFKTAQGFLAIVVKGLVAARPRRLPPGSRRSRRALPAAYAFPTTHSSTPNDEGEDGETDRPPPHETEDHERDPGRFSELIEFCNDRHEGEPQSANVNYIYIGRRLGPACQAEQKRRRSFC